MSRLLSGLAFATALLLSGCDAGAPTDAAAANAEWNQCPSRQVTVYGPNTLAPGASGTYTASMQYGCNILVVDWTATNGATVAWLPGSNGENVSVTAPSSGSFQLTARVEYAFDRISTGRKTVAVQ